MDGGKLITRTHYPVRVGECVVAGMLPEPCVGFGQMYVKCWFYSSTLIIKEFLMNTRWLYKCALPVMTVAILVSTSAGSTYYVNGACGNNSWTGTSADCEAPNGPKSTIQAGINLAFDGDRRRNVELGN